MRQATKLLPGRYYYVYTTVTNAIGMFLSMLLICLGTTKGSVHCYRTQSTVSFYYPFYFLQIPLVPSFEMDNIVVHDTTIDLVWKALNYEDCCGLDLKNYILQVYYMLSNVMIDGQLYRKRVLEYLCRYRQSVYNSLVVNKCSFTVENLIPKHQYLFRILAETIEGKSNYSSPLTLVYPSFFIG